MKKMSKTNTAFKHLRRTPYQAFAAVVITTVTFFVISLFSLLGLGASKILTYLESRPAVTAFFKDTATDVSIAALRNKLENTSYTESIDYISKDEALAIYREQNEDNPLLLEMVTADILPASLEVSAKGVEQLEGLAEILKSDPYVEEVVYQKNIIDALKSWVQGLRVTGLALSGLFLLTSTLIITVIIGLKIASRKEEIRTLSLLGASSWYIKAPFLIEGMFYGTIGAVVGWGISYLILLYLTPNIVAFLQTIPVLPFSPFLLLTLLGGQVALGILLGVFASLIATRRYNR